FFSAWEEGSKESLESEQRGQEPHDKRLPYYIRSLPKDLKERKMPENIRSYAMKLRTCFVEVASDVPGTLVLESSDVSAGSVLDSSINCQAP
ncbi:hypothetical protein AVEN_98396-1, partial [Araneus ventricosus]